MSELKDLEPGEEKKCSVCGFIVNLRRCNVCGAIFCQDHLDVERSSDQTDEHYCMECGGG
jgi:hypothetical protein